MDPRFNTYPQRQAQQPQPQVTQRQHQRFSWQAPVEETTQPAQRLPQYQEVQLQPQYQEVQRQPQYQEAQRQPQQPVVNTNVTLQHHRGFSYAPTPIEYNGSAYYTSSNDPTVPSSPVFTPIDDRPQSTFNMLNTPTRRQSQQAYGTSSHPRDEEALLSPSSPEAQTLPFMLVESVVGGQDDPAQPAQQPEPAPPAQSPTQQSRHARQMSNLSPINTNLTQPSMPTIPQSPRSGREQHSPGALPSKTPISPISAAPIRKDTPNASYTSHTRHATHALPTDEAPYSPHDFPSHSVSTPHAVFSPAALSGPNGLDFSLHQPGQIRHPNMDLDASKDWKHGLCSCTPDVTLCLTGLFCPCVLSGRTAYRLGQKSRKADATDLLGHGATNAHCVAVALACGVGLGWVLPMLQRTRVRHLYKLDGSCGEDCVKACCCCCCVAVQNEREVRGREEMSNRWAGPAGRDGYQRSGGMEYRPQH
ncbi:PLAC8-domain-containing protein [Didymella exigua CBS 183.55]|uniref:PLAC8-domain-containing protein n=1 Tax=Didymella exigua CBS 183.55 TaxID=1150837 RepID=A0A6A5S029_9PLEO|nr:PLAC8-domain-containing protein [Didymella exigua CBS 183.55]KAF1933223.1 PLAC8-domain-containing protein [Didymella exigua CBS 183.55]